MDTNTHNRKLIFIAVALFIGIVATFLIVFPKANPAYASGLIRVSSSEGSDIQFISANTADDLGTSIDPGKDVDVGQCTASLNDKEIDFKINNGYPNYYCTLSVRLKNLSTQTVRLQNVVVNAPEELVIFQPGLPGEPSLQPGEEVALEFVIRIHQNSEEFEQYHFSIQLIFEEFIG